MSTNLCRRHPVQYRLHTERLKLAEHCTSLARECCAHLGAVLETFKAISSQLPLPERTFDNPEYSPVTVKREGLNDSLEVPANLDDTLITPQAGDHWPPTAVCPQFLTNCLLLKQTFTCFQNISGSVFIHTGSVFLVRKIAGRKKISWSAKSANESKPYIT